MKNLFRDILDIEDVHGVIFLSLDGKPVFSEFVSHPPKRFEHINWRFITRSLDGVREAELVFENRRFFIKKTPSGYIFVVMGETAPAEMVRLNCDILIPNLDKTSKKPKGLGRFFKRG
jgi:hypothetical protein